jgi:hypothetical protein
MHCFSREKYPIFIDSKSAFPNGYFHFPRAQCSAGVSQNSVPAALLKASGPIQSRDLGLAQRKVNIHDTVLYFSLSF